jgi:hypothetical protein
MQSSRSLFAVLLGVIVGVVGLSLHTASAAPCCSAPLCQREVPPAICAACNPACFTDSDDGVDYEHDFDYAAGVCYLPGAR